MVPLRRLAVPSLLATLVACAAGKAPYDDMDRFFAHYTRTGAVDVPTNLSGPHADVVVNLAEGRRLVFARDQSYRSVWSTPTGEHPIPHLASIAGDGPEEGRFDTSNQLAYARIVEQSADRVVVHWRYFPVVDDPTPTGVVHELFTITADGDVSREHRAGTERYGDWVDPAARTLQTFRLTADGLADLETTTGRPTDDAVEVVGVAVSDAEPPVAPVGWWRFDEGMADTVTAELGTDGGVTAPLWKAGVSGTALAFDGYTTAVTIDDPPVLERAVTVAGWVALGALPWNRAPLAHQGADFGAEGFYLGIDPDGRPVLEVQGQELVGDRRLARNQWTHLAAVAGPAGMALYVDGERVAESDAGVRVTTPEGPLVVGLNTDPIEASDGVRDGEVDVFNHFSSIIGLEGLIDEVQVYDVALDAEDVADLHADTRPASLQPDLQVRALPDLGTEGATFGAVHTRLAFHDLWDRLWRVSDVEDVVVRFDDAPIAFAYWRGTTHGMNAVTDGYWMSDQSVEIVLPEEGEGDHVTLGEHMSDKQALRSHVRVLENTPARVVVQWRYGVGDVFGTLVGSRGFTDETHTIYPDGVAVRDVHYYQYNDPNDTMEFYQDFQWLVPPDVHPSTFMEREAVSLADLDGPTRTVSYPHVVEDEDFAERPVRGNIAVMNTKTEYKVFGVAQGGGFHPGQAGEEFSPHITWDGEDFPFPGPWNHWPVGQIPSDGRFSTDLDRVAHFAVGNLEAFDYGSGSMLVGFTKGGPGSLVPLARAWRKPPEVIGLEGLQGGRYKRDQRAFEFDRLDGYELAFTLEATGSHPVVNPCFVIRHWNSDQPARVFAGERALDSVRQGITVDEEGNRMLVVFVEEAWTHEVDFGIRRQ